MLLLRSTLFNIVFYANTIAALIAIIPVLLFGKKETVLKRAKIWARTSVRLQEILVGTHVEIEGLENLPREGGYIVAAQHQSFWDTFAFFHILESPVFIFKKELLRIPVFGKCLLRLDMIPVDRSTKGKAMAGVLKGARREIKQNGRQLFIFPEGTRRKVGAPLEYRHGVARIYEDINVPIVPIALASGLFWPRHSFLRQPGTFKAKILLPIEPGLTIEDAMKKLMDVTQNASDEILIHAQETNPSLYMTPLVKERLDFIKKSKTS